MKELERCTNGCEGSDWWAPIEELIAGVSLNGLRVLCPECKTTGLLTSRWVKGATLKPTYILHITRRKVRSVCKLSEEKSRRLRGEVSLRVGDIRELLESRRSFVLFSGGKDSLATLIYLRSIAKNASRVLSAIYVDTTAGIPENERYVKRVCKYLGVDLKIVRPRVDYFTLAKEWGIPNFKCRWCCRELKIKPIAQFLDTVKEPKVVFDGIRAAESSVRRQYIPIWYHPAFKCLSVSPIFHWSHQEVLSLINNNGVPKTLLHSLRASTECWCGAYKKEADFRELYEISQDMFHKLAELEDGNKNRFTFIYKNGKKKSLKRLEKQILREKKQLVKQAGEPLHGSV